MAEHDLNSVAFPTLSEAQTAALGRCPYTMLQRYRDGERIFESGQCDASFFIVKSGKIEIVDESADTPKTVTVHGPGQFTGAVSQLSGSPTLVSGIARGDCEAYQVSGASLREILNQHPDLARRVERTPIIEVLFNTEVRRMAGDGHLSAVEIVNNKTRETGTLQSGALFSFIGATPWTDWLPAEIERDNKAFVRTGVSLAQSPHWTSRRQPFLLETSRPGVFAAGDVRSGSVKRVASAVGEGSMAVQFVHEYLKEM